MKKTNVTKSILALCLTGLLFTACTKDEVTTYNKTNSQEDSQGDDQTQDQDPVLVTAEDVTLSLRVDKAIDEVNDFSAKLFPSKVQPLEVAKSSLHDCMKYDCSSDDEGTKMMTITFDEEGCEMYGRLYKGKIVYKMTYDKENKSYSRSKTYENFSIDEVSYNGTIVSTKQCKVEGKDPQMTHSIDLTITLEEGKTITRKGEIVRTWVGTNTPEKEDDAFEKTGTWVTTLEDGTEHYYKITAPIRYIYTCMYPVSGTVEIKNTDTEGTLNYGDGECDNKATFTDANGDVTDIEL